jgi:hypothetical protein
MPDLNDYQTNAMALNRGEDRFRALFPTYNREPLLGEKASCKYHEFMTYFRYKIWLVSSELLWSAGLTP